MQAEHEETSMFDRVPAVTGAARLLGSVAEDRPSEIGDNTNTDV